MGLGFRFEGLGPDGLGLGVEGCGFVALQDSGEAALRIRLGSFRV